MELLILLGLLTVVPWLGRLLPLTRVVPLATAVLIAGVVVGPLFFSFQLGTQLSIDRLLLVAVVAKCGMTWWHNRETRPSLQHLDCLLGLLAVWLLISALPASAPAKEMSPTSRWLTFIAIPLAMYCVARTSDIKLSDLRWLINAIIGLGIYLGIIGVFEVANLHALIFPRYIADPTNWEFLGRARGPLLNPTGNGVVLTIAFAAAATRLLQGRTRGEHLRFGIAACIIGLGIVATLTRSVWIGGMLVSFCLGWIYMRRYMPALALFGMALLILAATVAPQDNLMSMKRDKHLSAADALRSIQLRPVLALVAWNMFQDSPLIGHGYGGYFHSSLPYLSSRSQDAALDAVRPYMQHNVLLSLLVDSGLLAAGLFVAAIGLMGVAGWKLAKHVQLAPEVRTLGMMMLGCLAGYLFNGMFHDVSVIPMANNFLLLFAGVTASVYAVQGQLTSFAPSPIASPAAAGSLEPRLALGRRANDLPPTSFHTS